jgi:hypothetical protein
MRNLVVILIADHMADRFRDGLNHVPWLALPYYARIALLGITIAIAISSFALDHRQRNAINEQHHIRAALLMTAAFLDHEFIRARHNPIPLTPNAVTPWRNNDQHLAKFVPVKINQS